MQLDEPLTNALAALTCEAIKAANVMINRASPEVRAQLERMPPGSHMVLQIEGIPNVQRFDLVALSPDGRHVGIASVNVNEPTSVVQ